MKKYLFTLAIVFMVLWAFSQSKVPQSLNYQGAIRNIDGTPCAHKEVFVRITIASDLHNSSLDYYEIRKVHTNSLGLYTIQINGANSIKNSVDEGKSFENIDWSSGAKFIRVEVDLNGDEDYIFAGASQILSVPFAMHAATGGTSGYNVWLSKIENKGKSAEQYFDYLGNRVPSQLVNNLPPADFTLQSDIKGLFSISNANKSVLQPLAIHFHKSIFDQSTQQSIAEALVNAQHMSANATEKTLLKAIKNTQTVSTLINHLNGSFSYTNEHGDVTRFDARVTLEDKGSGYYLFKDMVGDETLIAPYHLSISNIKTQGNTIASFSLPQGASIPVRESITSIWQENNYVYHKNENEDEDISVIDLTKYADNTDHQLLSIEGNQLSISNGNTIILPNNLASEKTIITSTTNGLEITGEGTSVQPYQIKIPENGIGATQLAPQSVSEGHIQPSSTHNSWLYTNADGKVVWASLPIASDMGNWGMIQLGKGLMVDRYGKTNVKATNALHIDANGQLNWGGVLSKSTTIQTSESETLAIRGLQNKDIDKNMYAKIIVQNNEGQLAYVTHLFEPFVFEGVRADLERLSGNNFQYQNENLKGANVKAITVFTGANYTRVPQSRLSLDTRTGILIITAFGGNDKSNIAIQWFR